MPCSSYKAKINELSQKCKFKLSFNVVPDLESGFCCVLEVENSTKELFKFQGRGSKKKIAEEQASELACSFLDKEAVQEREESQHTALGALDLVCTGKHGRDLRFLYAEAKRCGHHELPISVVLDAKPVELWRAAALGSETSLENALGPFRDALCAEEASASAKVSISPDGLRLSFGEELAARSLERGLPEEPLPSSIKAVVLRCGSSAAEILLESKQFHLEQVGAVLGGTMWRVIHHGKVGTGVRSRVLRNQGDCDDPDGPQRVLHLPSLYTLAPSGGSSRQINAAASWVAGRAVFGDAVLAIVRINRGRGGMVWEDFGTRQLAFLCAELLPEARFAAAARCPSLCRLPRSARACKSLRPSETLPEVAKALGFGAPRVEDSGSRCVVSLEAEWGGGPPVLECSCSASGGGSAGAVEQACLDLLRRLQEVAAERLREALAVDGVPDPEAADDGGSGMTVLREASSDSGPKVREDSVVHISHSEAPGTRLVVAMGTEMVMPEVERLLIRLGGRGARGALRLRCPPAGHRLLSGGGAAPVARHVEVEIAYVKRSASDAHGGLFSPTLAQQRYHFVEGIVERLRPETILDVGCGEGALIEHIAGMVEGSAPGDRRGIRRRVLGVDCSQEALLAAATNLSRLPLEGFRVSRVGSPRDFFNASRGAVLEAGLMLGDFSAARAGLPEGWEPLVGCDLVAAIEVVEHLDPEPLEAAAPVLLGVLKPKAALVTTPNIEYNQVIQRITKKDQQGRLRNPDHRFEWTRAEFQGWARSAAASFGYSVEFHGVGHAVQEEKALREISEQQGLPSSAGVGSATQAALFLRMQEASAGDLLPPARP
uniref:Small RNA 2'-O-methyltransferase n=2 Tax=Tetraselmis sp. GSL018 TaxID=582737 RepID=A0A061SH56_9CHLO|mmetsp:Transcript_20636/g.49137  ORF Transcript_20636/g.49137 Transcript_20636/m.49137 type:complete len:832 (-) Transcript_20636:86-2581(-)|eukprot:CAMPEP_0177588516 /NCGR_PEP_ID=MMETSP0419_2-20121207/6267_1 /TAXON_ID=582737 /ORGANISM="Tetraselmis sp., Strain GSL018" /LENGTH=831 /DNA_ID=CAMNT_0019078719 /DNA_START=167 /DNA_END=2662 /DNA_ORIENTATION=-